MRASFLWEWGGPRWRRWSWGASNQSLEQTQPPSQRSFKFLLAKVAPLQVGYSKRPAAASLHAHPARRPDRAPPGRGAAIPRRGSLARSAGCRGRAQSGVPSCPRQGTGAGGAAGPSGRREGPRELCPPPRRACPHGPRPWPRGGGSRAGERQGTVFEEADAVGDARSFLKGTERDRAPSRGDAWGGCSGLAPPVVGAAWGAPGARGLSTSARRPRQRAPRFRLDRLGLLYKMPRRAEGRAGTRWRGRRGPTCAPPRASGVSSGDPPCPPRPCRPGTLAPRHLARL
ncbi:hypothetical protein NN561_007348 [Cricetulus griseus]